MPQYKTEIVHRVRQSGIVAIIRSDDDAQLLEVGEALLAGGISVMEVTFTVPKAHRVLEQLASRLGNRILLGAGTILDPETARIAILSGADFLVSPAVNREVIALANRYDKPIMPGALTPTEILSAFEAGASIVKVFPCDALGPAYLKAIHGPLPQIPLMPTGGVNLETAAAFIKAGACALGVGGSLVDAKLIAKRDFAGIESLARRFVEVVATARAESH